MINRSININDYKKQLNDMKSQIDSELKRVNEIKEDSKLITTNIITFVYKDIEFNKEYNITKEYREENDDEPFNLEYTDITYIVKISDKSNIKKVSSNSCVLTLQYNEKNRSKYLIVEFDPTYETSAGHIVGSRY